ncbi:hypothetical protein M0R04_11495 [Candidatus Dojkabacteria bacterium]|jgi:hypothetical protein|nr:hypothetical protein [Candidatus Dojkabacteria bacterium]
MSSDINGFVRKTSEVCLITTISYDGINSDVPKIDLTAYTTKVSADISINPKMNGAFIVNDTLYPGNKRGAGAIDLQVTRTSNLEIASGAAAVAIGRGNTVAGTGSVGIGYNNTTSLNSGTAIGTGNFSSAVGSTCLGYNNRATGQFSLAHGQNADTFSCYGRHTFQSSMIAVTGDSQYSIFNIKGSTTGVTPLVLTADSGAASTANQVTLSNNSAYAFEGLIVVKQSGTSVTSAWKFEGLIVRGANAAATTLITSTITAISNTTAITGPAFTADVTNGSLACTVTGVLATNLRWNCTINTTEIIYA